MFSFFVRIILFYCYPNKLCAVSDLFMPSKTQPRGNTATVYSMLISSFCENLTQIVETQHALGTAVMICSEIS